MFIRRRGNGNVCGDPPSRYFEVVAFHKSGTDPVLRNREGGSNKTKRLRCFGRQQLEHHGPHLKSSISTGIAISIQSGVHENEENVSVVGSCLGVRAERDGPDTLPCPDTLP